ncbi:hypothetical protein Sango_1058300 [Sesamum angolense]|uniref:Reverse transcriptase domain-containing protein n=1 Tax=Sesamum angolense TaxID=2727404 RepID=A0AAE2BZ85_9LAMI|nr:hypothetical protein Sango_1058300 [Sesamum angolense]
MRLYARQDRAYFRLIPRMWLKGWLVTNGVCRWVISLGLIRFPQTIERWCLRLAGLSVYPFLIDERFILKYSRGWKCSYTEDLESGQKAAPFGFSSYHGAYGPPRGAIHSEATGFSGYGIELWESDLVLLGTGLVYAKRDTVERRALWDALRAVSVGALPWIVGGDFNTVLSPDERSGGSATSGIVMSDFDDAIADSALIDAGYVGSPYTWYSHRLRQRLDRVIVSSCWMTVFPNMQVTHLELSQSDHRGLLVEVECTVERKVSSFCFQHMWTMHSEFLGVVRRNWLYATVVFGNVFDKVAAAERQLKEADEAYDQDPCDRMLVERNRCSVELVRFWPRRRLFGDRKQHDREYFTDPIATKDSTASFFQRLLTAEPVFPEEMDSEHLEDGLTDEDRQSLCVMPTLEEVREVVFSIDPDCVAGPDGFGAVFFSTCWEIISEDVFGAVIEFFHGVEMPKGFTATTISLILKTASPTCWSEYQPISLCNVTNKICTKLMTIRLGHALPKVLSLSQSCFVPGRLLSDNIFLAQELIHSLESRRPEANMVLKFDMAKAYDRVSWEFLYQVLRRKGFPQCWISLVANAVSHCWFSILVNGEHAGFFHSTHDLRQGDPLSSALFVFAADYLSRGLDRLFAVHPTMYYQAPGRIQVSHLAYADDLMIFTTTCRRIMELLHAFLRAYERVSGQLINGMKSSLILGRQRHVFQWRRWIECSESDRLCSGLFHEAVVAGFGASHPYGRNTCMVATVEICIRLLCLITVIILQFGIASVAFEMWRSLFSSRPWVKVLFLFGTIIGLGKSL